jgi:hypothetical protein
MSEQEQQPSESPEPEPRESDEALEDLDVADQADDVTGGKVSMQDIDV